MVERTTPKIPIELAWDEYVASMEGRLHGQTDAFKFAWKAAKKEWVGLAAEDRLTAKYMQDAPDGIEAVIDYIEAKLKDKNNA